MEFLLWAKLRKPEGTTKREFFEVWKKESEAALAALESGVIKSIHKVAGRYEVIAVVEVESADQIDQIVHQLPIWRLGYAHIVPEIDWIPLRAYASWAEHLKQLVSED